MALGEVGQSNHVVVFGAEITGVRRNLAKACHNHVTSLETSHCISGELPARFLVSIGADLSREKESAESLRRALCLRPLGLALELRHELDEELVDGLEGAVVALLGEVQVVVHVVVGDGAVGLHEAGVDVDELCAGVALQLLGHQTVDLGVALAQRVRLVTTGQQRLEEKVIRALIIINGSLCFKIIKMKKKNERVLSKSKKIIRFQRLEDLTDLSVYLTRTTR